MSRRAQSRRFSIDTVQIKRKILKEKGKRHRERRKLDLKRGVGVGRGWGEAFSRKASAQEKE